MYSSRFRNYFISSRKKDDAICWLFASSKLNYIIGCCSVKILAHWQKQNSCGVSEMDEYVGFPRIQSKGHFRITNQMKRNFGGGMYTILFNLCCLYIPMIEKSCFDDVSSLLAIHSSNWVLWQRIDMHMWSSSNQSNGIFANFSKNSCGNQWNGFVQLQIFSACHQKHNMHFPIAYTAIRMNGSHRRECDSYSLLTHISLNSSLENRNKTQNRNELNRANKHPRVSLSLSIPIN